jgi:hypothetical protein
MLRPIWAALFILIAGAGQAIFRLPAVDDEDDTSTACADASSGGTARYLNAAAAGSNNGTDWTNAWTSLATAETNLTRGQTLCVADGTYSSAVTFNTATSGTTYITIKKATVADHGTSTGWSDALGDGTAVFAGAWLFDTGYWDFNGAVGGGPGDSVDDWPTSWTTGHGFEQSTTANTYNVTMCDTDDTKTMDGFRFRHIKLTNATSLTYTGTSASGWFRVETTGCSIDDVLIEYAYTNASMGVPFHVWGAHDWTIQYTYFESNGIGNDDNFHRETWSAVNNDRWIFRWNILKCPNNTGTIGYVNDGDAAEDIEFYGNIIACSSGEQSGAALVQSDVDLLDWKWCSNTIDGWTGSGFPSIVVAGGVDYTGSITKNNLWTNHLMSFSGAWDLGTISYNGYYSIVRDGCCDQTSDWADSGTNAQTFGANPYADRANLDYRLTSETTAGNLTSCPAGNSVDMFGCTRGGDGTVTRGALEYPACQ